MKTFEALEPAAKAFKEKGAVLYAVGGYVRNGLLGLPEGDTDIAGALTPDEAEEVFLEAGCRVGAEYRRTGTLLVIKNDQKYEYTAFREDSYALGSGKHAPTCISFTSEIDADAKRRDFTVNAIYSDVLTGEISDPLNGRADLESRLIRATRLPDTVFSEDPLRILRMVRLAAELGFKTDRKTFNAAKRHIGLLSGLPAERIREEFDKMLYADLKYGVKNAHFKAMLSLKKLGAFKYIIAPLDDCDGVVQNPKYHRYDVLTHILYAVKYAKPEIRLAALMHDSGKAESQRLYGRMSMHPEIGESFVRKYLGQSGLKYPKKTVGRVARLVKIHMVDLNGDMSQNKLKKFIAENRDCIEDLVGLKKADYRASGKGLTGRSSSADRIARLYGRMIRQGLPLSTDDLLIDGNDVCALGIEGADIKKCLDFVLHNAIVGEGLKDRPSQLRWAEIYKKQEKR